MPITLDATVLFVFGISQLAAYMGGGVVAWVITWEARRDRKELREERRYLVAENRRLRTELFACQGESIDMRGQLGAAIQELNKFTAVIDNAGEDTNR